MTILRPLGLAAGLVFLAAPTFAVLNDEASDTFDQGVELLRRGRTEEALNAFQKVLAMDLSNEEAYELWKNTDAEIWLEMLSEQGDLELVTKRLMSMAKAQVHERRDDAEAIRGLLKQVSSGDITARTMAVRSLSSDHGEYAVPYMLTSLNAQANADHRVLFMHTLTNMGDDVVLPLCAALDSPDAFLRRNVAIILGRVGDSRAAAFLARCLEADSDEGVRNAAKVALAECGGAAKGAEFAFAVLGHEYHLANPTVLRPDQVSDVVWSFKGGKLVGTEVPRYLYAQEMAKVAYYNALRVNPGSAPALSGLARTFASSMQTIADRRASGLDVGDEAEAARTGMLVVAAAGSGAVDAGLKASIREADQMAAIGLCRAVQDGLAVAGDGLMDALKNGDAVLRAEAALALAAQAKGGKVNAAVVTALGEAAGRNISRVVAVIDGDAMRAKGTIAALEAKGMLVNHWRTGAQGLANLYRVPGLDAILVADSLSDLTCDQVITEIQASSRFAETPVLILTANPDSAEELYGSRAAGILAGGDMGPLEDALSESMGRDRERADELSRRSSGALAMLAGRGVDVSGALAGLMATVTNGRPDEVTLPAVMALGSAGRAAEAVALAALAADDTASDAVREAAAMACAKMFTRGVDGAGCLDALHGVVTSDAALNVRGAAAAALGRLKLNAEMRAELLELVRVNVGE